MKENRTQVGVSMKQGEVVQHSTVQYSAVQPMLTTRTYLNPFRAPIVFTTPSPCKKSVAFPLSVLKWPL